MSIEHTKLEDFINEYLTHIASEFEARWQEWPIDLADPGPSETTIGLLRRQFILASHVASSPYIWTPDVAPILLRSMVEVYIWLAWIFLDGNIVNRCKMYIEDGLGQEKLVIKHRIDELTKSGIDPENDHLLELSANWIEDQKYSFFIDVNIGQNWSGLSTRKMAEESGCIDFYRCTYPAFSACTHSRWNHVGKFDLVRCNNPLHAAHRIPSPFEYKPDIGFLFLAAKYLDKTYSLVDTKLKLSISIPSALDIYFPEDGGSE